MESYVISLKEVLWVVLLLGLTMAIHGMGMLLTLRVTNWLKDHTKPPRPVSIGLGIVILATWIIIITSLVEVVIWGQFFIFLGAQPTSSVAIYHALVNYTTLDSGYLPQEWRLLEGLLAMAGLLTLAWSTGVLYTLVEDFQRTHVPPRRKLENTVKNE